MRRRHTLRARLTLWYCAVLGVTLFAFGLVVYLVSAAEIAAAHDPAERAEEEAEARHVLGALALGLPAALAVAAAGGWLISRRGLRPVEEIAETARAIGADRLDRRILLDERSSDEIRRLGEALNAMLDRLERSVEGMRRFTADASHELRTPIAALMGEIEVTLRRPRPEAELRSGLESALEELGRLARLVDALLTLARSDAGELPLASERLRVSELVRRVTEPYLVIAGDRGVAVEVSSHEDPCVDADPLWLGRALANLVDNACKFTPRGGSVALGVETKEGRVLIRVANDGPLLTDEERGHIFERFYRGIAVRGQTDGFGLGLAFARDLARRLGGQLRLDETAPRTTFVLDLPQSPS